MDEWVDGWMNGWMDGQGNVEREMGGERERQKDPDRGKKQIPEMIYVIDH
jgi:hypothetical protein